MKKFHRILSKSLLVAAILSVVALQGLKISNVEAAPIFNRSLQLIAGPSAGGSLSGGTVSHHFDFTLPTGGNVGSIKFEYCTTAANDPLNPVCVAPTGMDASAATLGAEDGIKDMTMHASATSFYLSRTTTFSLGTNTTVKYTIDNIVNPEYGANVPDTNKTFFVRIFAYPTLDASGEPLHKGTVAASTAEPIIVDGTMPESLIFCTGKTIGLTASVPDCSTATSGRIVFNQLFSPTSTASATSQMAASTNAGSGYAITVNGPTLTSGSNQITAMNASSVSTHGISQFGMNLTTNTVDATDIGAVVTPDANTTNYRGQPLAGYNESNMFKFTSGDIVANSGNDVLGGTDAQIYTVTYIANVPGSLPAGDYSTTLTYICTPTF